MTPPKPRKPAARTTAAARTEGDSFEPQTYVIPPGPRVQFDLQARVIDAIPGDVIQLEAGRYELQRQLDVAQQPREPGALQLGAQPLHQPGDHLRVLGGVAGGAVVAVPSTKSDHQVG